MRISIIYNSYMGGDSCGQHDVQNRNLMDED